LEAYRKGAGNGKRIVEVGKRQWNECWERKEREKGG